MSEAQYRRRILYTNNSSKIIESSRELHQIESKLSKYNLPREVYNIFLTLTRTVRRQILIEQLENEIQRVQSRFPELEASSMLADSQKSETTF